VVAKGTPEQVAKVKESKTGLFLKKILSIDWLYFCYICLNTINNKTIANNKFKCYNEGMKNFYEVLRVRTNATQAQIKKAFLYLVSKYHPDVYVGDKLYAERYTALLTEAYSVLKDPERRFDYDMKHNINTRPSASQLRKEDRAIRQELREERRMAGKNYEQEMSMRYFKNSERKKPAKKGLIKKILTSKLFYCLLFVLGIELLIVMLIYMR